MKMSIGKFNKIWYIFCTYRYRDSVIQILVCFGSFYCMIISPVDGQCDNESIASSVGKDCKCKKLIDSFNIVLLTTNMQ